MFIDMKRIIQLSTTFLVALCMTCAALAQPVKHYNIDVKDYTELKVIGDINVDYFENQDSAGYVAFEAKPEISPMITVRNNKGRLEVQFINETGNKIDNLPVVRVYSNFLIKAENVGDSTLRVIKAASCPAFNCKVTGNGRLVVRDIRANDIGCSLMTGHGTIVINGKCTEASLSLTGTGTIQADGLEAKTVKCRNTGTGTIGCFATEFMQVSGAGSGTIYYRGTPKIKKVLAMGVKIEPMDKAR